MASSRDFPSSWIPISLRKQTPTEMTPESLKKQLDAMGLTCSDADLDKLEQYIKDVREEMYKGKVQTYGIFKISEEARRALPRPDMSADMKDYEQSADGNWTINEDFPYQQELMYIQQEEHFDWLVENRGEFGGVKNEPPEYSGKETTVDAVKEQFIQVSVTASSVVVEGMDETDMEAVMSNAIAPLTDTNAKDYDRADSRANFIVKDYDPVNERARGLGILTVWWHLKVKDYKEKKKGPLHEWWLTVKAWAALYNDGDAIEADYQAAKDHFG